MKTAFKLISLLILISLSLSLIGCHGALELDAFDVPEDFDESEPIEITFWAKNDTNITQTRVYERAISEFEALYPNVKVTITPYTNYGDIYNDVIKNLSTGTTPNVCITYPDHIATYMTGGNTVVPLNSLMADEKFGLGGSEVRFDGPDEGSIIEKFLDECYIDGSYYAVPFMRSTEACYINKTYVESLGYEVPDLLTWDFIFEVSEAAAEKNADGTFKVNGQKTMIPFIYKSTDNMMIQMLKQKGADYTTPDGAVLLFNEDAEEILSEISDSAEANAFNTFTRIGYPANYLNKGQCIFAIDSTAGATWMGTDAPLSDIPESDVVHFETVVRPIPQYDVKNPKMISQGPSVCVFNKENKNEVIASWLFVQYLLSNPIQLAYAKTEGYAPVTSEAQNSPEYTDYLSRSGEDNDEYYKIKLDATKLLIENTDNTFITPVFNGSASVRNAAGELIEQTVRVTKWGEPIDRAFFDGLYEELTTRYRLSEINRDPSAIAKLGRLPAFSVWLIVILAVTWVLIGAAAIWELLKRNKLKNIS